MGAVVVGDAVGEPVVGAALGIPAAYRWHGNASLLRHSVVATKALSALPSTMISGSVLLVEPVQSTHSSAPYVAPPSDENSIGPAHPLLLGLDTRTPWMGVATHASYTTSPLSQSPLATVVKPLPTSTSTSSVPSW